MVRSNRYGCSEDQSLTGFEDMGTRVEEFGSLRGRRMTWFRDALVGFRDVGSLLIKRGTVMGPLVPLLFVALVFVLAAWLFRSVAMLGNYIQEDPAPVATLFGRLGDLPEPRFVEPALPELAVA